MTSPLLILGASTRAAAFSAIRAGFQPICGDMFADSDLQRFARLLEVPDYPQGLAAATQGVPSIPWIYTGALENWPSQIAVVAQHHSLWGNQGSALRSCRNFPLLLDVLQQYLFPTLEIREASAIPPRDGTWLVKPVRSSAGRAVAVWDGGGQVPQEPHYFQRHQSGAPVSAAFVGLQDLNAGPSAELLGVSCQLSGMASLNSPEFGYCGSVVPSRIEGLPLLARRLNETVTNWQEPPPRNGIHEYLSQVGNILTRACGLRGLFGIDFIWDGSRAWMLEVNPRYTASMELLENSLNMPLLEWHRRACVTAGTENSTASLAAEIQTAIRRAEQREIYFGKVIQYADRSAIAPDLNHLIPDEIRLGQLPEVADIPVTGCEIQKSQPVFTCLGSSNDPTQLLTELLIRSKMLWGNFGN